MDSKTVQIAQQIHHEGEVNRALFIPQYPSVIATKTNGSDLFLFNCNRHPARPQPGSACDPDLRLKGHTNEGYGLSWRSLKAGYILSGSNDAKICLWDIHAMPHDKALGAKEIYAVHKDIVEDVSWHLMNENLFGSVGDDKHLMIWDLRSSTSGSPQHSIIAHEREANSLSFNPFNERLLATASSDKTVNLFDLRKLTIPLHTFSSHTYVPDD